MIHAIISIVGGALAASPLIIEKRPSASNFLSSIAEYKGFFGVVLTFWGLRGFFRILTNGLHLGSILGIASVTAQFIVGFLLAYELIQKYLLKNSEKATEIGEDMKSSLSKYQVPAGIVLIILGILSLF